MTQVTRMRSARGIGAYAAERREQQGITQAELAQRAGVSREWVSRFERGDGSPSLRSVMTVLRALNVELFAEYSKVETDVVDSTEST
ncbi:MAG: helix-turn-helix domain-containing protein [Leucobacter sp.]